MPPLTIRDGGIMLSGRPSGCPSVRCPSSDTYFVRHDISLTSGWISMKLVINMCHESGH